MGWFDWFGGGESTKVRDFTEQPPTKSERQQCYEHRDKYFDCLAESGDDREKCKELRDEALRYCPNSWIRHFEKVRKFEKAKKRLAAEIPTEES
eukprot:Clim_evm7s21 gene=Clim_evmTU7s21